MSGVYFTKDELEDLTVQNLRNVLNYLGVAFEPKTTKPKLILLLLEKQVELQPQFGDPSSEPPKYSVRIQRIMDAKAKGEMK